MLSMIPSSFDTWLEVEESKNVAKVLRVQDIHNPGHNILELHSVFLKVKSL